MGREFDAERARDTKKRGQARIAIFTQRFIQRFARDAGFARSASCRGPAA
jgi:hypothetical protein